MRNHTESQNTTSSDGMTAYEISVARAYPHKSGWVVNKDYCGSVRTSWLKEFRRRIGEEEIQ